jgi:NADH:ubiquinone oxidoreductase subunit 4 (subunit M)
MRCWGYLVNYILRLGNQRLIYSSIGHMAVCILGILSNSITGITGSLILSIAHGFVSPGLFIASFC